MYSEVTAMQVALPLTRPDKSSARRGRFSWHDHCWMVETRTDRVQKYDRSKVDQGPVASLFLHRHFSMFAEQSST